MRTKLLFLIFCTAIISPFLIGCGSVSNSGNSSQPASPTPTPISSQSPTPTPTPTPSSAVPSSFIYGIEAFESDIGYAGGKINSTTGQVTPVGAFDDSGLGQNIVIQLIADPQGRFLYSLNLGAFAVGMTIGNPGIAELQINQQTGALTRVAGSPIVFNSELFGELAIDGTGHFLYEPDAGSFDIYAIDQNTGALTKTTSVTAAPSIGNFTTTSPNGRFMFNASNDMVETLSVDGNGNLALVQPPVLTGGSAIGVVGQLAVSADNQFLYVMNQGSISIFSIGATGTLTPVIGSPFVTDASASGMALTPDGTHVYIAFQGSTSVVKGFTFNSAAGSFTPIAGAVISDNATSVTVDGSGKFAYISENFLLSTYSIDPATGNLILVSQAAQPVSENTQSVVVVP
jgi:6-phosphogluconolactonase (cycloisomerase 2 family)